MAHDVYREIGDAEGKYFGRAIAQDGRVACAETMAAVYRFFRNAEGQMTAAGIKAAWNYYEENGKFPSYGIMMEMLEPIIFG